MQKEGLQDSQGNPLRIKLGGDGRTIVGESENGPHGTKGALRHLKCNNFSLPHSSSFLMGALIQLH